MAYQGKRTKNSMALSAFIGSRMLPGRDGKPQKPMTADEAERYAEKRMRKEGCMAAYIVTYKKREDDRFASANLVWADEYRKIQDEFSDCDWFAAHIAPESEVRAARAKGMPERWLNE